MSGGGNGGGDGDGIGIGIGIFNIMVGNKRVNVAIVMID